MDKLKAFFKESILPHVLPIVILFAIGSAFFYPALQGYSLKQGDVTNWLGAAHESTYLRDMAGDTPNWTSRMFSGMPTIQITGRTDGNLINPIRYAFFKLVPVPLAMWMLYAIGFYVLGFVLSKNRWISLFGGIIFSFSTYLIIILEAGHNTKAIATGFIPLVVAGVILLYRKRQLIGFGLTAFAFALQLGANHVQVTYYMAMLLVVFGVIYGVHCFKSGQLNSFLKSSALVVTAFLLGVLPNLTNLINTYQYGKLTTRGKTELTIGPDGQTNASNVTSGLDRDYVVAWSYGLQESWSLLVPNASGGASGSIIQSQEDFAQIKDPNFKQFVQQVYGGQLPSFGRYVNTYWGDQQFTSGPVYIGAGVILLAILAMFFVQGYLKWVFFGGIIFSLTLSWGKNMMWLTDLFLDFAPGYNKFRAVTIIMIILEFCFPALALLFVKELVENTDKVIAEKKKLLYVASGVAGVLILFYLMPSGLFDFTSKNEQGALAAEAAKNTQVAGSIQVYIDALKDYRAGVFRSDVLRSLLFVLASFGLVYVFLRKKFRVEYFVGALCLISLIDLFQVNRRYLNTEKQSGKYVQWEKATDRGYPFSPSGADMEIFSREVSRGNWFKDAMYADGQVSQISTKEDFDKIVADYLPKLKNKGLEVNQNVRMCEKISALTNQTNYRVFNLTVSPFNDASTSYFHKSIGGYHGAKLKRYQELIEFHLGGMNHDVLNMLNTRYFITQQGLQENPMALGNAWFVKNINWVANADEEIMALKPGFEPSNNAVIDERFKDAVQEFEYDSSAAIVQTSYHPDRLTYQTSASIAQFAVFSEIHYDLGWRAFVDGEEVPITRVNYVLRGLNVPAGDHILEFKFELPGQTAIASLASIGSLGIIVSLLLALGASLKLIPFGNRKEEADN